jgi:hypothetical protein
LRMAPARVLELLKYGDGRENWRKEDGKRRNNGSSR